MVKKINYGEIPPQRNWNRMTELSQKGILMTEEEKAELSYRIHVQNYYANNGEMPKDYIPVGERMFARI